MGVAPTSLASLFQSSQTMEICHLVWLLAQMICFNNSQMAIVLKCRAVFLFNIKDLHLRRTALLKKSLLLIQRWRRLKICQTIFWWSLWFNKKVVQMQWKSTVKTSSLHSSLKKYQRLCARATLANFLPRSSTRPRACHLHRSDRPSPWLDLFLKKCFKLTEHHLRVERTIPIVLQCKLVFECTHRDEER